MNRLKKFWHDHKTAVKLGLVAGGTTAVVLIYREDRKKIKKGRELQQFNILTSDDPDAKQKQILWVKHLDGEEGYYPILEPVAK